MQVHTVTTLLATIFITTGCLETEPGTDGERIGCVDEASSCQEVTARHGEEHEHPANNEPVGDATGMFTTVSARGFIDLNNGFFRDLGSNGRRCVSCHAPSVGRTITPQQLEEIGEATETPRNQPRSGSLPVTAARPATARELLA